MSQINDRVIGSTERDAAGARSATPSRRTNTLGKSVHGHGYRSGYNRQKKNARTKAGVQGWRTRHGELTQYADSYWPMPNSFVRDEHLNRLWTVPSSDSIHHSASAISVLPVIGVHANTMDNGYWKGHEGLARLAGISPRTVQKAAAILNGEEIGKQGVITQPNGLPVSVWTLDPIAYVRTAAGPHPDSDYDKHTREGGYFSFPARALYGGNWAAMEPILRAVYLALGGLVKTHPDPARLGRLLDRYAPAARVPVLGRDERRMICFASLTELQALTGISKSAISSALRSHEQDSGRATGNRTSQINRHHLFSSFPTQGNGKRLFALHSGFVPVDEDKWGTAMEISGLGVDA